MAMTRHASPIEPTISAHAYVNGGLVRKVRQTTLSLMSQKCGDLEYSRHNRLQNQGFQREFNPVCHLRNNFGCQF